MIVQNLIGKITKGYIFQQILGKGQFGTVYLCHHQERKEIVAIKVIELERFDENEGILGQLVQQEIDGMKKVKSKYVVRYIDDFRDNIYNYLVMEYCDSGDLEQQLKDRNFKITEKDAIGIFKQILCGLKDLHANFIVHRDLKMSNILIHNKSIYKIADLGFCKTFEQADQQSTLQLGSVMTMAPEIFKGEPYGLQSDIFSLGVIFYYILYKKFPFNTNSYTSVYPAYIEFKQTQIKVSDATINIIKRMLEFDPQKRITFLEISKLKLGDETFSAISKIQFQAQQIDLSQNIEFYQINSKQINIEATQNFEKIERLKTNPQQLNQQIQKNELQQQNPLESSTNIIVQQGNNVIEEYKKYKEEYDQLITYLNKQLNRFYYITNTIKQIVQVQIKEHYLMALLCIKANMMINKFKEELQSKIETFQQSLSLTKEVIQDNEDLEKLFGIFIDLEYGSQFQQDDIAQQLIQSGNYEIEQYIGINDENKIDEEICNTIIKQINKTQIITYTYYHIMQCALYIKNNDTTYIDVDLEETFNKNTSNQPINNQQQELQKFKSKIQIEKNQY